MTTEIRNWAVVAAAMEAKGATDSQMYRRAKASPKAKSIPYDKRSSTVQHLSGLSNQSVSSAPAQTWGCILIFQMTNHHLSVEQRFH